MKTEWFEFTQQRTSQEIYNKLSQIEKEILNKYKDYILISAGEMRAKESIRELLRFRKITGTKFNEIDLEDLRHFLMELKKSNFADYTKNKIRGHIQKFLRWSFRNWSERFDNFEDIKCNSDAQRKKPITSKEILSKEEIEMIMKAEPTLYWKTFFIVQYMGAFRTGEVRKLRWSDITFDDDDYCYIKVSSSKNKNATAKFREIPLDSNASYYLKELKKEQKNKGIITEWVFHGRDPKEHISKAVNLWFKELTKRAIGREVNNYLLRHTRGTELRTLVKQGGMSKDNAVEFMGHSEKMFNKVYSHMDKEDVKKLMKQQIYNFEYLPEEKKHELELEIEKQNEQIKMILNLIRQIGEGKSVIKVDNKGDVVIRPTPLNS